MSTIDSVICYDKPCPCGEGRLIITSNEPDHPYVRDSQKWYEIEVNCESCKKEFMCEQLDDNDQRYIILKPYNYEKEIIRLISIDRFCRGLI
jgi:hypothetical protein